MEENEVRVSMKGQPSKYMKYGLYLLNKNSKFIVVKASGNAISKAYIVAELVKRKMKGIHQ